jgi:hypothetical protein
MVALPHVLNYTNANVQQKCEKPGARPSFPLSSSKH